MVYELMGWLHATAYTGARRLGAAQRGQGTVEYVGLILLLAVILAGVVMAAQKFEGANKIPDAIVGKLKEAIGNVKLGGGGK